MGAENPPENPDTKFSIIKHWDPRLNNVLGHVVDGKFENSYSDFLAMKHFGLEVGVNSSGDIQLSGEKALLEFSIAGYIIPGHENKTTISKGSTFRIFNNMDGILNLEIKQPNKEPFKITFAKKK